jgi:dipeptidase E
MVKDLVNIKSLSPKVLDMLDIAALPKEMWLPRVESADVIVVGGGNAFYLSYCFQQSGFFDELPRLLNDKAYVGISAGSMIVGDNLSFTSDALASHHDTEYDEFGPEGFSSAKTTKFVDFVIRPHYLSAKRTGITKELLQAKVKEIKTPLYAIDDMSAVRVIDGKTDVISEGEWEYIES